MEQFVEKIVSGIGFTDILDILIVTFIIYKLIGFIRETRAEQLAKGLLLLVIATLLSKELQLYTLHWILSGLMTVGLIAVVVIFQPELRRGLEYLGRSKFVNAPFEQMDKEKGKHITSNIVKAIDSFSRDRVGALIVFERQTNLTDIMESGTIVDAEISDQILGNIFYEGAPLHDGAVIIRDGRVYAAGCVLPLTKNNSISKDLGTRHRAGIGITENSDALTLIVSEETGIISIAEDGQLSRFLDVKTVEKKLLNMYMNIDEGSRPRNVVYRFINKIRGNKNAEK